MTKRILTVVFPLLLIGLAGRPAGAQDLEKQVADRIDRAKKFVEQHRELPFHKEVNVQKADRYDYGEKMIAQMKKTYGLSPGELGAYMKVVHLIPTSLNLEEAIQMFYLSSVAAFYRDQSIYIREQDNPSVSLLVHEFTHAVEDDNFYFIRHTEQRRGNYDGQMALWAVLEGTAETVESLYRETVPDDRERHYRSETRRWMKTGKPFPAVFELTMDFPYRLGHHFVESIRDRSGWAGVNGLLLNPPVSTEQILHPERYFSGDVPVTYEYSALDDRVFEAGGRRFYSTTFGELGHLILFSTFSKALEFKAGTLMDRATGWEGDRIIYYDRVGTGRRDPDRMFAVWLSSWESVADRKRIQGYLETVFSEVTGTEPNEKEGLVRFSSEKSVHGIWAKGSDLVTMWNVPSKLVSSLQETLPEVEKQRTEPVPLGK